MNDLREAMTVIPGDDLSRRAVIGQLVGAGVIAALGLGSSASGR